MDTATPPSADLDQDEPIAQAPSAPVADERGTDTETPGGRRLFRQRVSAPWARFKQRPDEERPRVAVQGAITAVLVTACCGFVFFHLHPNLIFADTTPAGGDMGAHVWGPAYLRDELLTSFRLTGWTPDWYAGFPAFQFYMVVPSLLIVLLDLGRFPLNIIGLAVAGYLTYSAVVSSSGRLARTVLGVLAGLLLLISVPVPYGVAFKIVTVLGVVFMPLAAYAMGRLMDLRFPGPVLLAVATLPFLFETVGDAGFTILGGNIASTMAGEFAFSISLTLALVYLGLVARGLETGRHRALAAILLALIGLCHIIPAFFALLGTAVLFVLRPGKARFAWVASVGVVGGLLSAFWIVPFFWRRAFLNDMGWEKKGGPITVHMGDLITDPGTFFIELRDGIWTYFEFLFPSDMQHMAWIYAFAAVGLVLSFVFRVRVGMFLAITGILTAVAFVVLPQGRLWNARLLPFWYLCIYLLAGLAVALLARSAATLLARDLRRPLLSVRAGTAVAAFVVVFVIVSLPLQALPLGKVDAGAAEDGGDVYEWLWFSAESSNFVDGWAAWNFNGYEWKPSREDTSNFQEYSGVIATMSEVGAERGCGRAMWEYEPDLNRYGTPMALMLLPYWTDGCIGSMEGLYFEASSTTPYHFLNQSELSTQPSRAQRDLPYRGFDIDKGIEHLQLLGVKYYMAISDQAIKAAGEHPALTEVATSGPWVIFEVADSELVEPLDNQPAVWTDVGHSIHEWLDPSVDWYQDSEEWDVFRAVDGPDEWQEIEVGEDPERVPVPATEVSGIDATGDTISFDVDDVGTPVLVKASYFPNWKVRGADGPYRVTPNLMVVVPTERHVELYYGWTPVDIASILLSVAGLVLVGLLLARPDPTWPPSRPFTGDREWYSEEGEGVFDLPTTAVAAEPREDVDEALAADDVAGGDENP